MGRAYLEVGLAQAVSLSVAEDAEELEVAKKTEHWKKAEDFVKKVQEGVLDAYEVGLEIEGVVITAGKVGIAIATPIPGDEAAVIAAIGIKAGKIVKVAKGVKAAKRAVKQMKKLSKDEIKKLKKAGHDIHDLKGGKGASKYDLFKDKDGNIHVKPKDGSGPGDSTGINVNDL